MKTKQNSGVFAAIRSAAAARPLLTAGTLLCVAASVGASLLPPLLLGRVIDRLTGGIPLSALAVLLYFGSLALEGLLQRAGEPARAVRPEDDPRAALGNVPEADAFARRHARGAKPRRDGRALFRRCGHRGGAFTSGIISMAADACRILSIMAVIAVKTPVSRSSCCWCCRCLPCSRAMYRSGCSQRSSITAALSPPFPAGAGNAAQHPNDPRARSGGLHGAPVRPAHRRELCRRRADKFLRRRLFAGRAPFECRRGRRRHAASPPAKRRSWRCSACRSAPPSLLSIISPAFSRRSKVSAWRSRPFNPPWRA